MACMYGQCNEMSPYITGGSDSMKVMTHSQRHVQTANEFQQSERLPLPHVFP